MAGPFNWIAQVVSVSAFNVRTLPQRVGSSLTAVLGIAGVVAVMVGVLSIAQGIQRTMERSAAPENVLVLRGGATTEMMSGLSGDDVVTADLDAAREVVRIRRVGEEDHGDERIAGALLDGNRDRGHTVDPGIGDIFGVAVDHAGHVFEKDHPIPLADQGNLVVILHVFDLGERAQKKAAAFHIDLSAGDIDVRALDRLVNIQDGQAVLGEAFRIDIDLNFADQTAGHFRGQNLRHQLDFIGHIFGELSQFDRIDVTDHRGDHDGDIGKTDLIDLRVLGVFGKVLAGVGHFFPNLLQRAFQIGFRLKIDDDDGYPLGRIRAHFIHIFQVAQGFFDGVGHQALDLAGRRAGVKGGDDGHRCRDFRFALFGQGLIGKGSGHDGKDDHEEAENQPPVYNETKKFQMSLSVSIGSN